MYNDIEYPKIFQKKIPEKIQNQKIGRGFTAESVVKN